VSAQARHLEWPGCFNVRDLGGLSAAGGRLTARGAVVRADSLARLTPEGWQALLDHGVRTVVDLRRSAEREAMPDAAPRPDAITTVHVEIDGSSDRDFWQPIEVSPEFGTPLYYSAHLMRKPQLSAAAVQAIARAQPGGVVFHCVGGRDRSGMVAMLVLALLGVTPAEIAADYELSGERLAGLFAALGEEDQAPELAAFLTERGTSVPELIETTLSSLDIEGTMRAGGLSGEDLQALRDRMLGSSSKVASSPEVGSSSKVAQ
jgi:protein-tyrosine phosphatase